jgi:transcription antitermination factor NusG
VADGAKLYPENTQAMATIATSIAICDSLQLSISAECQPLWYAAYTSANHEKKVAAEISRRGVESFLPLYRAVRRWSDRRVELEMPLFPGYVFVHLALRERLRVLQVPGVAKLVGFGGLPVALPDEQVEALRAGLDKQMLAKPHSYLVVGRKVRVVHGPLTGAEGVLVRSKGIYRVVLSLELIMRSVAVEVAATDVEPLPS